MSETTHDPTAGANPNASLEEPRLPAGTRPWAAVLSMLIGFFMIMIDTLIVSVANPTIQEKLDASFTAIIWVTSAYLLAMAVPLMVAGRLGDRFGQKTVFMAGMALFTVASLGCGLSRSIAWLIAMRVFQGLGGALMTPQTQALIVRIFPPVRRGAAMGLSGAVSGIAMLVAPLLGGVLVDHIGWQAIFLVNAPIGVVGLILVGAFVPRLDTSKPRFDWAGTVISATGLFLLIFGLQEGSTHDWGHIWGPITIWELIGAGIVLLVAFVVWQIRGTGNPLVPMRVFRHRDFSFACAAMVCVGFAVATMPLPLLYYLQIARGYSAIGSALFLLPMAVIAGIVAPVTGGALIHRLGARTIAATGLLIWAVGMFWITRLATPTQDLVPWALIASGVIGVGNAMVWSPLSVSATWQMPAHDASAGVSIFNTVRTIGSVLGSACVATLMNARITAHLSAPPFPPVPADIAAQMPRSYSNIDFGAFETLLRKSPELMTWFVDRFSPAMGESLLLPVAVCLLGAVVALGLSRQAGRG